MFPVYVNDNLQELPNDDICYIVAKEGVFLKKRIGVMESIAPVTNISILNSIQSMAKMHVKKIPAISYAKVESFFREVYNKFYGEAVVLLFYDEEKHIYKIVAPKQEVSGANVDYKRDMSYEGYTMIGTIHSHANFSAFHSGTDSNDEKSFDGLHITIGNILDEAPSVSASIVANGHRVIVDPTDYIEGIEAIEFTEAPIYTSKVFKYINGVLTFDEQSSQKSTVDTSPFKKRFKSSVSEEERVHNKKWIDGVEKYTPKININTPFNNPQLRTSSWGKNYDETAWEEYYKLFSSNIANNPLNVGPNKYPMITFPSHQTLNDDCGLQPCLSCKYKHMKLLLEETSNEDVFECIKCNTIVESEEIEPVCPVCKTDEYLVEFDGPLPDSKDNYVFLNENHYECPSCLSIFNREKKDELCPFCRQPLGDYNLNLEQTNVKNKISSAVRIPDPTKKKSPTLIPPQQRKES